MRSITSILLWIYQKYLPTLTKQSIHTPYKVFVVSEMTVFDFPTARSRGIGTALLQLKLNPPNIPLIDQNVILMEMGSTHMNRNVVDHPA